MGGGLAARILARSLAGPDRQVIVLLPSAERRGEGADFDPSRPWIPLGPLDLQPSEAVPGSGWPIAYEELEPWFVHVRDRFALPMGIHDERVFVELPIESPFFDRTALRSVFGHFAGGKPDAHVALLAPLQDEPHLACIEVADEWRVQWDGDGKRVESLRAQLAAGAGGAIEVQARSFVFAGDVFSNPRWLRGAIEASDAADPDAWPGLGRPTAARARLRLGTIEGSRRQRLFQLHRRRTTRNDFLVEPTLTIARARLEQQGTLGIGLRFAPIPRGAPRLCAVAAFEPAGPLAGLGLRLGARRLGLHVEFPVFPDANAPLETGAAGTRLSGRVRTSIADAAATLDGELERLGFARWSAPCATGDLVGALESVEVPLEDRVGTTRMAANASEGAVDEYGRVFSSENLYLVGPSILPTVGWSDPLHPVAALTLRLAQRLERELAR